ncbi:MerR family transcriptional regulator [Paenibacillus sp. y28]|uniref:MerR family transcriptional regulator n=1 Tax=Paenibacillus sp. y28 TaxID=3129110 RepID=UPI0030189148
MSSRLQNKAIRYYEKKGLLPLIEHDEAGRRLFSEDQISLLETVVCYKMHILL